MVGEEETADLRPEVLFPALAAKVLAKMLRSNLAWGSLNSLLPSWTRLYVERIIEHFNVKVHLPRCPRQH